MLCVVVLDEIVDLIIARCMALDAVAYSGMNDPESRASLVEALQGMTEEAQEQAQAQEN